MSATPVSQQYPPTDYHPNMVNTRRMQDVQDSNLQLLAGMLEAVLHQPRQHEDITRSHAEGVAGSCDNGGGGVRSRFAGYQPERVYRAVHALVVLEQTASLRSLLDEHVARYGEEMQKRLAALPIASSGNATTEGEEERTNEKTDTAIAAAGEVARKRTCLSQHATCTGSAQLTGSTSSHSFHSLVRIWRDLVRAASEVQTVWSAYASRYESKYHYPGATLPSPAAVQAWGVGGGTPRGDENRDHTNAGEFCCQQSSVTAFGVAVTGRTGGNVLRAAVTCLADAIKANEALFDDAVKGCVLEVTADVAQSRAVPRGPTAVHSNSRDDAVMREKPLTTAAMTGVAEGRGRTQEAESFPMTRDPDDNPSAQQSEATTAQKASTSAQRHSNLRDFTHLCMAVRLYEHVVGDAMVAAVEAHYQAAATAMLAEGVPAAVYFSFASESLTCEQQRAQAYMSPSTGPRLREVVERALLGAETGVAVLRRDFAALFEESTASTAGDCTPSPPTIAVAAKRVDAVGGDARAVVAADANPSGKRTAPCPRNPTLGFIWRLLSRCAHVPREPVMDLFRDHVGKVGGTAVDAIVRASAAQGPRADALDATRAAVAALMDVVRDVRRVIASCFAHDGKVFQTHADECLQRVLRPHAEVVAEALAGFVDNVFRQLETGEMPLTLREKAAHVAATQADEHARGGAHHAEEEGGEAAFCGEKTGMATTAYGEENDNNSRSSSSPVALLACTAERKGRESGEEVLGVVAYICSHFPSIDQFERLHWRDMSRRLLHPYRRANFEAERCFLRIFEGICGNSFISKFESMLKDMATSETLTQEYKEWVNSCGMRTVAASPTASLPASGSGGDAPPVAPGDFANLPANLDLSLHFVTSGLWPPYTALEIRLPCSLQCVVTSVESFYHRTFARRALQWQHQLSYGTLRARLQRGAPWRQLSGTLVQCLILIFLDEHLTARSPTMTVGDLCAALNIPLEAPEVMGSLLGLCHARFPLLTCANRNYSGHYSGAAASPPACGIRSTDELGINMGFVFTSAKMRVPFQVRLGGGGSGAAATLDDGSGGVVDGAADEARAFRERGDALQSVLMRYMKAQRTASHDEVVAHLQAVKMPFTVTTSMVKKTLDKMMERNFLERKGPHDYSYVA